MNTLANNEVLNRQPASEDARLEKARFIALLDATFANAQTHRPEHRTPSFYPHFHRVQMSKCAAQSYSSDVSVTLKLQADRYTLLVT